MTAAVAVKEQREVLWQPHEGPQTEFTSRLEDFVLFGGSKGPGKTDAILFEALRQVENPHYKALLVRRTFPQLQEIVDRAHVAYPKVGGKWVGDQSRYVFPSGAVIQFGHCQHEVDKERYQGHEFSYIGFDQLEQFLESQFNFIVAQNRSSDPSLKCYVRATANPGGVGHWWIKRRFLDGKRPGVTYKDAYALPDGRKVTRTWCFIRATVYDNPTLLKAQPTYLATLMSLPEVERKAYLDGDWNVFASQCVFDGHGMRLQEEIVAEPSWIGFLREDRETYRIEPSKDGNLRVWETPRVGQEYLIGADIAEGDIEGDFLSAHVVNRKTWEVVAHWHGHVDPLQFGEILYSLGRYYNLAEIAPEVNGPGVATVGRLKEMGYPVIYEPEPGKFGYRTDQRTRHNMIATLLESIRESSVKIKDRDTLDEMYNFVRNPANQKMEARESCKDDRVMSLAIALQCIRTNPLFEPPAQKAPAVSSIGLARMRGNPGQIRRSATGYR